ncbi:hypothetical protein B0H16DRAFT_1734566 [Mycena metata]|uniref:Uncharacterized protein n=1 Tax=Mycena metata TaxID=1033252 RepID=A0AAD7MQS3_9AGAR|nr:hypothetical protein B0H16DRAFT_1734566 [Mycena metata]
MTPKVVYSTNKKPTGPPYKILSLRSQNQVATSSDSLLMDSTDPKSDGAVGNSVATNSTAINSGLDVDTSHDGLAPAAPLPTLRTVRAPSPDTHFPVLLPLRVLRPLSPTPEPLGPEDEEDFFGQEDPFEDTDWTAPMEDTGPILNPTHSQGPQTTSGAAAAQSVGVTQGNHIAPVAALQVIQNPVTSQAAQGNLTVQGTQSAASPTLTTSSKRSMGRQTSRSFEVLTGTTIPRVNAPSSSGTALTRTGSSSTVVTFDDMAPSELEIYTQAALVPIPKSEKAPQYRTRTDENVLRLGTHVMSTKRQLARLKEKMDAQHRENLIRLEDLVNSVTSLTQVALPAGAPTISAEVKSLTDTMKQTRDAVTGVTAVVNDLVEMPREVGH